MNKIIFILLGIFTIGFIYHIKDNITLFNILRGVT